MFGEIARCNAISCELAAQYAPELLPALFAV
jgi:hypothetical protein